jgi:hypothetical protein
MDRKVEADRVWKQVLLHGGAAAILIVSIVVCASKLVKSGR